MTLLPFGSCPFCGVPIQAHRVPGGFAGIQHGDPVCEYFVRMDGDRYVAWVMEIREMAKQGGQRERQA